MFNPHSSALVNFNFQRLEVVSLYRDPQLQVAEKKMNANIVLCNNYDRSCIMLPCAMYNVIGITFKNVIFILNLIFIAQGISVGIMYTFEMGLLVQRPKSATVYSF